MTHWLPQFQAHRTGSRPRAPLPASSGPGPNFPGEPIAHRTLLDGGLAAPTGYGFPRHGRGGSNGGCEKIPPGWEISGRKATGVSAPTTLSRRHIPLGEGGLPEGKISTISLLTTSYLAVLTGCVPSPKTVGGRRFPSSENQQFSTNSFVALGVWCPDSMSIREVLACEGS